MNRPSRLFALVIAAPLALGACKKKQPPVVVPEPVPAVVPQPERPPVVPTSTVDTGAEARRLIAEARAAMLSTIYFEYDTDELRDDARANLDYKIRIMNANPTLRIRIAGHTDDRGSDEYNIALGRRRSEAAKRYLTDRGIDAARIETTTMGRERPAVMGTGESIWAQNRRDEFEITAGGDQLRAP